MFAPKIDILPLPQRRLWDELSEVPPGYGGTAVALHLGHRQSVDFDFFGDRTFEPAQLQSRMPFMAAATITQQSPNTLSAIVDRGGPVKLSFFGLPAIPHLSPPHVAEANGLRIDARSWAYWNSKLGRYPAPPMPTRKLG